MRIDVRGTVELARWWWTFILRGTVAILFGIAVLFIPPLGLAALVGIFAAYSLIDGVTSIFAGVRSRGRDRSWWLEILEGVVGIAAGVIALIFVDLAATILIWIIAAWAIVTGVFEILAAIRLREQIEGEFWLGLAGAASILFGILIFVFPAAGALSVVWLIAGFAIAFGVFLVILGWRLRTVHELAKTDAAHDYAR